jgi:hypothetical protein
MLNSSEVSHCLRRVSYDRPVAIKYGENARQSMRGYYVGNAQLERMRLKLTTQIGWKVDFQILDLEFAANNFSVFVGGLWSNIQGLRYIF